MRNIDGLEYLTKEAVDQLVEDMDRGQWTTALSTLSMIERALKTLIRERQEAERPQEKRDRLVSNRMTTRHRYRQAEIFRRVVYGFEPFSRLAREHGCSASSIACRVREQAIQKGCPRDGARSINDIRDWFDRYR